MLRTLLSLAAGCFVAASLSAQCVPPTSFQTTNTFEGNSYFGLPSFDAGACCYFELEVKANVTINQLALNFLNGGGPTPNLIGTTASVRWWMVDLTGGINGGLVLANVPQTYSITNGTNPLAPWVLPAGGTGIVTISAADTPSLTSGFSLSLTPGTYGVCLVTTPNGTAFGSTAPNANRLHPRFSNVGAGSPLLVMEDQTFKFTGRGVRSIAFGAFPAGQYMPNLVMNYTLGPTSAYSTSFGKGCYDRMKSFYEGSIAPAGPGITPSTCTLGSISMLPLGSPVNQYVVTTGPGYPLVTPNSTTHYGTATHLNAYTPGPVYVNIPAQSLFGGWDDTTSAFYTLPFTVNHPGGSFTQISVCSNGVVYCGPNATATFVAGGPRIQMFYLFTELIGGPPAYAAFFGDLWLDDGWGGMGNVYVDSDGSSYVAISWVGVREYPNTANGTFGNSFQIRFNSSGAVDYAWGACTQSDSAPVIIGYSAGDGRDPGSGPNPRLAVPHPAGGMTSFVTAMTAGGFSFFTGNGDKPPILQASARPKHGSVLSMDSSNLDPNTVLVVTWISPISLGVGGLPLAGFGMPACNAYAPYPGLLQGLNFNFGAPTSSVTFGVIPPVLGDFHAQAVGLSIASPQFNAPTFLTQPGLGALVSNAVCLHVDAN